MMLKSLVKVLVCVVCVGVATRAAEAAPILASATTISGGLLYEGLGENPAASGRGTGRYTLGTCAFASGTTTCTLSGTYVEGAGSSNDPGGTGTFSMRMIYAGSGPSPIIARSATPGDNILNIFNLGGGHFELDMFPTIGGSFSGVFPDVPFSDSIGFAAFLQAGSTTCTGAPAACSIGQVGLTPGSSISGPVSAFSFSIPQPDVTTPVPEPGSLLLVGSALVALAGRFRRRVR